MNQELARYAEQLQAVTLEVNALLDGISDKALNWRPNPGKWSVAECIDHLAKTGEEFFPKVEDAMKRGRTAGKLSPGPFRHGFMGNMMVRSLEPPVRMPTKSKTTPFFSPTPEHTRSELIAKFDAMHAELARLLVEADGLDLKKIKVQSMVVQWLKLSLGQWFAFILAHERRHIWQAKQVIKEEGFPGK